ncbi:MULTISPECIES: LytR/AlgR family response regulator transcription factor [Sphingobacterium]|jgi:two-component system response regulator LytT|uniref:LytTR family DNA-binding domain-containing protein n=2 Tax=Sphingobacterium TaxID=28453 RepID=A0ABV0BPL1_9SPHI|nr:MULTISPECIES: LytTR family DNA-binding domain-containing protein [Sphingobacterium]MCW2262305.1 DNA-binding LytR/AlgR family response regulator [Sphingobacterium kitahiroshimense]NJI74794.1 response regulator transcription factor [Sphingobacterium sp. B16(2022)]TCR12947.1 LytTR family two component transcriptional regulator [Sphingobacterium sp. JUb78]
MFKKILIVEDENWASESLLEKLDQLIATKFQSTIITTVREATDWLLKNEVDLIFMDVQLGDGLSFEIFDQVKVQAPVIFTTAFEDYALKAFQNQGYAYLLKPYDDDELQQALNKVAPFIVQDTREIQYKTRFLVRYGMRLKSIPTTEIAYFMAEDKILYGYTKDGDQFIVDDTITGLVSRLDPTFFFQVNRKFIIHIDSIIDMLKVARNRIRLQLQPALPAGIEVIVSEDKSSDFQMWLDR